MFKNFKIGGVEPASMLERPGKISAIVFMNGCNLRCPFCHNPELVENTKELPVYPIEELFKLLEEKRGWVDSVIFTGGEPTLFPQLPSVVAKIRELGFETGVHTNGTNPRMLADLISRDLVDYLALDVKSKEENYPKAVGLEKFNFDLIKKSIDLIKKAPKKVETIFRTTVVPKIFKKDDIHLLGALLKGARKAGIQQFRPTKCLDKSFESLTPYDAKALNRMADILERYVGEVDREFI